MCLSQVVYIFLAISAVASGLVVEEDPYSIGFVTAGRNQNWPFEDAVESEIPPPPIAYKQIDRMGRADIEYGHYNLKQEYKLRFRPLGGMPSIYWHKFPQQQQESTTSTTAMPTEEMEVTTVKSEPTPAPVPEPEPEPEPEITTTIAPSTWAPPGPTEMLTTTTTTKRTPTKFTTPTPATTMTTIMRPPTKYKFPFGHALKQLLFGTPVEANLLQKQSNAPKTKGKGFLSLFEVIKFENNKCTVAMEDIRSMEGVCYHEFECKSLGGIPTERCAEGVGVCCIFLNGCGDTTKQSVVYFESPNYPSAVREMMICVLIVNLGERVQQLRLDFLMFELNRPTDGDCVDDQFIISGHNINFNIPVICGINTGQHIYVHAGQSSEQKIYLSFFAKVPTGGRSFNIKITQLETNLAPDGCLQYYTDSKGTLKSFNYDLLGSIVDSSVATYFNNLNYVICIERGQNTCAITYNIEQFGGEQPDFQIVNKGEGEIDLVPDEQAGAGIFNCPDDFIGINQVRLCGERFNDGIENEDFTAHAAVRDIAAGPFMLPFRTDAEYVGRGFRLIYKQELCA